MSIKKSLENRIRGWFPKEFLGVSLQSNMYSESVPSGKFVKTILGSITVLLLIVLALSIRFSISIHTPLFAIVMSLPSICFLFLFVNFREIKIRITANELIVKYGILSHKHISMSNIVSCEQTKANFGKYLGVGIRYGSDGSYAFSTSFSSAVKINQLREKPFVFSSKNPEEICTIINRTKPQAGPK